MKRLIGIALGFVLGTGLAQAGGIGGLGGGGIGLVIVYDQFTHSIWVPGQLDEHFEINRRSASSDSGYYMDSKDFRLLQAAQDTRQVISAKDEGGGTRSYRVISGDQPQQVELIDRRAAARSGER